MNHWKQWALLPAVCFASIGCTEYTGGGDYPIPEIVAVTDAQLTVGHTLNVDLLVVNQLENDLWTVSCDTISNLESHSSIQVDRDPVRFRYTPVSGHEGRHALTFTVYASEMEDSMTMNVEVLPE